MGFVLESLSDQERDQENTRRRRHGGHDHGGEYTYIILNSVSHNYIILNTYSTTTTTITVYDISYYATCTAIL